MDAGKWKQLTRDLHYTEEKKPAELPGFDFNLPLNGKVLRIVLFTLVIILLGLLLMKILQNIHTAPNKRVPALLTEEESDPTEDLTAGELREKLSEALSNKRFRTAVRLYYLICIRSLSEQELIRWQKNKTNRHYVREMAQHPGSEQFRELTLLFEYTWYGDLDLDEPRFASVQRKFDTFLQTLKTPKDEK
jgi:hypothetical protein